MQLTSPKEVKSILKEYQVLPKKNKGQNFLISEKVLNQIVASADLKKTDRVLEIGPGLGILTQELALKTQQVTSVELDKKLSRFLIDKILPQFKNIELIENDILKLFKNKNFLDQHKINKVVANLPYQITSQVLRQLSSQKPLPETMVFLVQKEVAERIVGQPPQMSLLSLAIQFYWEPKIITKVEATKFWPQPRVDSAILKLTLKSDIKYQIEDEFFKLIKVGFSAKRKKLSNNLKNGLKMSNQELDLIFKKLNLNLNIRAQELRSEDWFNLVKIIF